CYHVPYASSTMLISNSAEDKDGATACRIGFELLFTIIGTGVFGAVSGRHRLAADCGAGDSGGADSPEQLQAERRGYALAALVIAGIYFACGLFATFGIRERVRLDARRDSLLSNVRSVLAFRPYVLLMLAFLCMSLGIQTVQANLGLYTTHSLGMGGHMNSGIFTVLTVAVLLVPFWARMSGRFGKKRIFMIGLLPQLPCLMLATALPPNSVAASGRGEGDPPRPLVAAYYAVIGVSGVSISVAMLLPWSMLPDVIDDFYCRTGERREATFYSLYVFFTKFASGLSLALSQLVLSFSGYDSNSCEQPYSVALALRYLLGPGPIVCVCLALLLMHFYPIDKPYREGLNDRLLEKLEQIPTSEIGHRLQRPESTAY
uniref:MFS domain-containing protein n=1 Tax=Macrostomum lignano TaxID=282301 RepID=A0A1I8J773_9PLAT